jgi:hypothetical protein
MRNAGGDYGEEEEKEGQHCCDRALSNEHSLSKVESRGHMSIGIGCGRRS